MFQFNERRTHHVRFDTAAVDLDIQSVSDDRLADLDGPQSDADTQRRRE